MNNLDQMKSFTWFNYFARGVFHHNLTSIKMLKCELKSTQSFHKSYLICHMQIIPVSLEHLGTKHMQSRVFCLFVFKDYEPIPSCCIQVNFRILILPPTARAKMPLSLISKIFIGNARYSKGVCQKLLLGRPDY